MLRLVSRGTFSESTRCITSPPPRWSSTARSSPPPRRSGSTASSTVSNRTSTTRTSFPSMRSVSVWIMPGCVAAISTMWHILSTPSFAECNFAPSGGRIRDGRKSSSCGSARCAVWPSGFFGGRWAKISFRASPSGACCLGVFPVRLRSRGYPHHRRHRRGGLLDASDGRWHADPDARNIQLSPLARLRMGGDQRSSWFLALRRLEGHRLGSLRQSRGLPSPIAVGHPRRRRRLCGRPGSGRLSNSQVAWTGDFAWPAAVPGCADSAATCRYCGGAAGGDECGGHGAGPAAQTQSTARQSVPCRRRRPQLPSAPHDAGTALGAALVVHFAKRKSPPQRGNSTPFLGPAFNRREILAAVRSAGLAPRRSKAPARDAAELIAAGKIVAWFQGRMEFGPRALGNRSLLADPRRPDMRSILNRRIKHREDFRPFAPSVVAERADEWFEVGGHSTSHEFMLFTCQVKTEPRDRIPAVVHPPGSARLHLVRRESNPGFHDLISCFFARTGVPVVINTSFNDSEPIVCTPADAIVTFRKAGIDALFMDDVYLTAEI